MLSQFYRPAPPLMPQLNIGFLIDYQTGDIVLGRYGESYINGGLPNSNGTVGRGNVGKTMFSRHTHLKVLGRYASSFGVLYETEITGFINRVNKLGIQIDGINGRDLQEEGRFILTNSITPRPDGKLNLGDLWFEDTKEHWELKRKDKKQFARTLPFVDNKGVLIPTIAASVHEIDSFSAFTTSPVSKMHDENQIGDKGNNTDNMRDALIKTQMLVQLPGAAGSSGAYVIMTAHVGDDIPMDPRSPPPRKLDQLKSGKIKNVPEKFTFLPAVVWYVSNRRMLWNDTTKSPEYPREPGEELKGDPDLVLIGCIALRLKSGMTGMPFEIIYSQTEGLLESLTEFWYCKTFKFGISGLGTQNFQLEMYPDVNLTRTTLRKKFREDPVLRRVMTITSELAQINILPNWSSWDKRYKCDAKTLYKDIAAMGYEWKTLLNTRGYWQYEEDLTDETLPFLSTVDLLKMRAGEYHPYWLAEDKKTVLTRKEIEKKHNKK